jgi:hypothetical protein
MRFRNRRAAFFLALGEQKAHSTERTTQHDFGALFNHRDTVLGHVVVPL